MTGLTIVTRAKQLGFYWLTIPLLLSLSQSALAIDWPQEITTPEGSIIIYQPQPESLAGNVLTGRSAMSLELKDNKELVFGAFWFKANIETDKDEGTALITNVEVTRVGWPESRDASEQRFTEIVATAVPESGFEISLEQLSASLADTEREKKGLAELKTDPPNIIFRDTLAVLLLYDGEPRFSPVENSDYERALNTPFLIARNTKTKVCYLSSGQLWYSSKSPLGPWIPTSSPPADLTKMIPDTETENPAPKTPPEIVVATEPTELIATDGKAEWQALAGGELLYVENTETPWLRELSTDSMYILLSGRWFRAGSANGPWKFVRPDQLPTSFKNISPDSDIGGLRVSVAGTEEAEEAMLDADIPQTAAIKRSEASLDIQYSGEPEFEKISGTGVSYAVNTGAQVLEINNRYYAVDNGVWFKSPNATGPWSVADEIPEDEIRNIPPSSPVYNTTYVHVYHSTPEVVYVGYTPGYMWSFPYYGVPVYGTGWYYPPYWYGPIYYPRAPTWGMHVGYNPWTGWNFGVSWSYGFLSVGVVWGGGWGGAYRPWGCCGGWYGGGYHRPVVIHTGDINIGNNINVGNRTNINNKLGNRTDIGRDLSGKNLYRRPENRVRNAERGTATRDFQKARTAQGRDNNLYADRNGNVARRAGDGWETRDKGSWKPSTDTANRLPSLTRDNNVGSKIGQGSLSESRTRNSTFDRQSLDRSYRSRQTGASRQRARSAPRRGGGRRR